MRIIPFTANRLLITDLLTRAKEYHCSITAVFEYDVTELLEGIEAARAAGREVGLVAVLVKATAMVMEKHPRMNHHLFRRWGRWLEVEFDHINCTLIVARDGGPNGEQVLFPIRVDDANQKTVEEIHAWIRWHKQTPLEEVPQFQALQNVKKMNWFALKWFNYKARSDPEFHQKYFGTYGLSSMVRRGWGGVSGSGVSNAASGFVPATIRALPRVVDGEIAIRQVMTLGLVADHYLLDGVDIDGGMTTLREYLETTTLLD